MTSYMYDAAYVPNLDAVKAHGGIGMSCYLTGDYASTSPQPRALRAAGLFALGNYERGAGELVSCGYARGVQIGKEAATAYIAKGAPRNTRRTKQPLAIYFSVDVNVRPSSFPAVGKAFDGIRKGLAGRFEPRVYGEGALIDYLVKTNRVAGPQWLSASSSFPGYNANSPNVGLVQKVGTPVHGTDQDVITCKLSELGAWWPAGIPTLEVDPLATYTLEEIGHAVVTALTAKGHSVGHSLTEIDTLAKATNTALAAPGGLLPRVASLQAQVATLSREVAALRAADVAIGPLVVSGTLTVGKQ